VIETRIPRSSAAPRRGFIVVGPGVVLLSLAIELIALGPSTAAYFLGTDATLGSVYGGMVMACVGIVVLARGVRHLRSALAYSA
jgi:hypothetical protein